MPEVAKNVPKKSKLPIFENTAITVLTQEGESKKYKNNQKFDLSPVLNCPCIKEVNTYSNLDPT